MITVPTKVQKDGKARGPSREEIETLCLLHALRRGPCGPGELARRLGLAPALAAAVTESLASPVASGWVASEEGGLRLTEAGEVRLDERLAVFLMAR